MTSTREFNFSEEDFRFTYEILLKRYSDTSTLIKGVTPLTVPSYEEHKNNIKTKFSILRIALLNNDPIGIGYIDKTNIVGFFYHFTRLKYILKNLKIKNLDLSEYYLKTILSYGPKDTTLYARVSVNNKLANKTASRLMKFVSGTDTHNTYSYINE